MKNLENIQSTLSQLKQKLTFLKLPPKFVFIIMGIGSTLWFLIRVVPKPQRAGYPCMKAATPIMSGFILYLLSLGGMTLLFRKAITNFKKAKYITAVLSLAMCFVLLVIFNWTDAQKVYSNTIGFTRGILPDGSNNPMGKGIGIYPGRVVWAWDKNATDETCVNTTKDAFYMKENNNQEVINEMLDNSIKKLAGSDNVKSAWDALFNDFNKRKKGTAAGYKAGETIFIKVNNGQAGWAVNKSDLSETGTTSQMTGTRNAVMTGTTPATVVALVRQLVDSCNVPQENIYIADPMAHVYKSLYDVISPAYPDVVILDRDGYTNLGRTKTKAWTDDCTFYSDNGDDMPDGNSDNMMQEMYDADYLINASALKAHARAGISLAAKNHFGSHGDHPGLGYSSFHLHAGLICTVDNDVMTSGVRGDYGSYRVLVDLMGHERIGRNTLLFIVDGLWSGIEATDMPVKWKMAPFNNDFPNSLFVSQDGVAVESVGLDFLRAEADKNTLFKDRPFFPAVDDHLHQAADKNNWPNGLTYDPEGDGTEIPSLGVHEHWNNATDKLYSINLGSGTGIQLVGATDGLVGKKELNNPNFSIKAYPNPCSGSFELSYQLKNNAAVTLSMVSADGKVFEIAKNENLSSGSYTRTVDISNLSKGIYMCRIQFQTKAHSEIQTVKLVVE